MDANTAPGPAKRKYWVQFRVIQTPMIPVPGAQPNVFGGEMGVDRELPICGPEDLQTIGAAILAQLVNDKLVDTKRFAQTTVQVVTWTAFEQPSLVVMGSLPPERQH